MIIEPHIKISWDNDSLDIKEQKIYKSLTSFDINSLPEDPLILGPHEREYLDYDIEGLTDYYYMTSCEGTVDRELFSPLFQVTTPDTVRAPAIYPQQFFIDEIGNPYIYFGWSAAEITGPVYIYRSDTPIDPDNLPSVYVELEEGSSEFTDTEAIVIKKDYYYMLKFTVSGREELSNLVHIYGAVRPTNLKWEVATLTHPTNLTAVLEWSFNEDII